MVSNGKRGSNAVRGNRVTMLIEKCKGRMREI